MLSLLLFVAGYLVLATLDPLVAASLLLAREPAAARI